MARTRPGRRVRGEGEAPGAGVAEVELRLARRYPTPRVDRKIKVALIGAATVCALTWLVSTALTHARPAVDAQVLSFDVRSDTTISAEILVQRRDPTKPAVCRLLAQSTDFQPVAEKDVDAPADHSELTRVEVDLTTLRRATSIKVTTCRTR
ncbi:hypothetical protein GCM10022197_22290 [Microlunatus spumicola]|uniref:DUF4307 domain-containing protein n=1 Tax=Microlunatus spumicola TaxID=81499 RepID=A0ABP6XEK5_9ACTN